MEEEKIESNVDQINTFEPSEDHDEISFSEQSDMFESMPEEKTSPFAFKVIDSQSIRDGFRARRNQWDEAAKTLTPKGILPPDVATYFKNRNCFQNEAKNSDDESDASSKTFAEDSLNFNIELEPIPFAGGKQNNERISESKIDDESVHDEHEISTHERALSVSLENEHLVQKQESSFQSQVEMENEEENYMTDQESAKEKDPTIINDSGQSMNVELDVSNKEKSLCSNSVTDTKSFDHIDQKEETALNAEEKEEIGYAHIEHIDDIQEKMKSSNNKSAQPLTINFVYGEIMTPSQDEEELSLYRMDREDKKEFDCDSSKSDEYNLDSDALSITELRSESSHQEDSQKFGSEHDAPEIWDTADQICLEVPALSDSNEDSSNIECMEKSLQKKDSDDPIEDHSNFEKLEEHRYNDNLEEPDAIIPLESNNTESLEYMVENKEEEHLTKKEVNTLSKDLDEPNLPEEADENNTKLCAEENNDSNTYRNLTESVLNSFVSQKANEQLLDHDHSILIQNEIINIETSNDFSTKHQPVRKNLIKDKSLFDADDIDISDDFIDEGMQEHFESPLQKKEVFDLIFDDENYNQQLSHTSEETTHLSLSVEQRQKISENLLVERSSATNSCVEDFDEQSSSTNKFQKPLSEKSELVIISDSHSSNSEYNVFDIKRSVSMESYDDVVQTMLAQSVVEESSPLVADPEQRENNFMQEKSDTGSPIQIHHKGYDEIEVEAMFDKPPGWESEIHHKAPSSPSKVNRCITCETSITESTDSDTNASFLPDVNLVEDTGKIYTRTSWKSLLTKKWNRSVWMLYGEASLYIFRCSKDMGSWLSDQSLSMKERDALVKVKFDFLREIQKSQVRGYKLTPVKFKMYHKDEPKM